MTILETMLAKFPELAGKIEYHYSDVYAPASPDLVAWLKENKITYSKFHSELEWVEIPFGRIDEYIELTRKSWPKTPK